jgi:hypothetical protein
MMSKKHIILISCAFRFTPLPQRAVRPCGSSNSRPSSTCCSFFSAERCGRASLLRVPGLSPYRLPSQAWLRFRDSRTGSCTSRRPAAAAVNRRRGGAQDGGTAGCPARRRRQKRNELLAPALANWKTAEASTRTV